MDDSTYTVLRTFADTWGLVGMFVFFVGVLFWAFRPGASKVHEVAATAIFRNEKRPARFPIDPNTGAQLKEASK